MARTLFYMVVRYEGNDGIMPDLEMVEAIPSLLNALGEPDNARRHADLYGYYKTDDNARDRAVAAARRRYPAANHAAESVVIYDLRGPGFLNLEGAVVEMSAQ